MKLPDVIRSATPEARALMALVAGLTLFRLIVGGLIHLTEDEAYYRLWSLAPQAGYYDHPPMIAWWIWIGRHLAGDSALGARLLPIVGSALQSLIVYDGVRRMDQSPRTALTAAVFFNATLLVAFGAILAIPDAPAALFWTLTVWCVLRAVTAEGSPSPPVWWAAAGLAAGLACLSKYSALFLAPGVLAWLVVDPRARRQLAKPWPWLAIPMAAALFEVNVAWNAGHDWQSFHKQFGRVAGAGVTGRFTLEFLAGQLLLLNPLIAVFVGLALVRAAKAWRKDEARSLWAPTLAVSAPFIAYLLIHSLHDKVQAHWPAPLYPGLAAAAAIAAATAQESAGRWRAGLRRAAGPLGVGAGALALIYLAPPLPALSATTDPARAVRGWGPFAAEVEALRRQTGAAWVGTLSYGEAAELADEPAIRAPVLQLEERDRYRFLPQSADLTRPGLVLDLSRRIDASRLQACFRSVRPLGHLHRTNERHGDYAVFAVADPIRIIDGGCADTGG